MLEFVITRLVLFAVAFLAFTAVEYYEEKLSLKQSVKRGLYFAIFVNACLIAFDRPDYQLISISIVLAITIFLLNIAYRYYVYKQPLKEEHIMKGLIMGILYATTLLILVKLFNFITWAI